MSSFLGGQLLVAGECLVRGVAGSCVPKLFFQAPELSYELLLGRGPECVFLLRSRREVVLGIVTHLGLRYDRYLNRFYSIDFHGGVMQSHLARIRVEF